MKVSPVIAALLVVTTLVPAGVVGSVNEPPLPDAGLDQTVQRSSEVFLDGTGSRDPDGRIVTHEWTITTPDGRTVTPTNDSNPRASFDAALRGRYAVSLTVTDDDGASRTDTMYVTVERGRRPTVHVSGPETPTAGSERTYTATFDRGAAPLDRIVWEVDGVRVANDSLTPAQSSASFSQMFGTTGTHTVSATVTDTDGLNASASHRLTVRSISTDASDSEPTASGASRHSPTVDGSRLVTGERPLSETYRLRNVPSSAVRSVTWRTEQGTIATGRAASVRWNPGDHTLFAVVRYTDGSRDVARFPNGGTDVTADPQPSVSLENLVTSGRLAGDALATDGYDNLQSVDVELDGEPLTRWPRNLVDTGKRLTGKRRVSFTKQVETGSETTLTVTATDHRGQRVTVSKQLSPTGTPEIVESGFVNTPVDSYHERIDPDRYVAKHVMKVDLNGVDPGNVTVRANTWKENLINKENKEGNKKYRRYNHKTDTLDIVSYWSADVPNIYPIEFKLYNNKEPIDSSENQLNVQNSPPEVRLEVIQSGVSEQRANWGIIVDASSSFDPDGTRLNYIWSQGADPITEDNTTAKFDSLRRAKVKISDQDGYSTFRNHSFHQYFVPQIAEIKPSRQTPYNPNETVTFTVKTESYRFSKVTYGVDLETKISGVDTEVQEWHRIEVNRRGELTDTHHWEGTIEVPASEMSDISNAKLTVFNEDNPKRIKASESIPSVTVLTNATPVRRNITVTKLRYVLDQQQQVDRRRVQSQQARNRLFRRGYQLEETVETGTEHVLQKRVKVRDAEYETRRKEFYSSSTRRQFVQQSTDWTSGGSTIATETWTATETEWRSDRSGRGQFTGETRQKMVDDADYRRKHQYKYTREITKTGTRTDWEYRTKTVEETRTRTVTKCSQFGCFDFERTYTVEVEDSYRVPVTETYSYTVTERETYWAFNSYHYSHTPTGKSRLIKVAPPEYETQYKYQFTETREQTYRVYEATRQVQVKPAQYDWKRVGTVEGRMNAYRRSRSPDYRITDSSVSYDWILTKQTQQSKVISKTYQDESNVLETRARVQGTLVKRMFNPATGEFMLTNQVRFKESYTNDEMKHRWEIVSEVKRGEHAQCDSQSRRRAICRGEQI